jgi:hypothetical protein|nr:MAG TPA: hypothetical protein [Bacteriophage sp.]
MRPTNILKIKSNDYDELFLNWFLILKPLHNLSNKECILASKLYKYRDELKEVILDKEILDTTILSDTYRKKIIEEMDITMIHLQVLLTSLRKKNVIIDNRLNPKFIPHIKDSELSLLIRFEIPVK